MNCAVPSMGSRGWTLFPNTFVRYFFASALAASTFALRSWLIPLTRTGALIVVYLTFLTKKRMRSQNANRQLRESEEKYRINQAVLDSMAANIAVIDREGNITAVNDAWKRFAYENDGAAVADSVGVNYLHVKARSGPLSGISVPTRSCGPNSPKPHSPGLRFSVSITAHASLGCNGYSIGSRALVLRRPPQRCAVFIRWMPSAALTGRAAVRPAAVDDGA
jgi:hypothetical protein